MYLSSLEYAHMTPRGNNFFEFNLKAFRICPGTLAGKIILDVGGSDLSIFGRHAAQLGATVISIDSLYEQIHHNTDLATLDDTLGIGALEFGIPIVDLGPLKNNVAALAQAIPFADNTFDLVVSFACVPSYLPSSDYPICLVELLRVTRGGGTIHLAPVDELDNFYPLSDCNYLYDYGVFELDLFTNALNRIDTETEFHYFDFEEVGTFNQRGLIIHKK